jgi:hypothetical protein
MSGAGSREQRLKEVVIRPVDERDANGCAAKCSSRRESTESAAENDNVRSVFT